MVNWFLDGFHYQKAKKFEKKCKKKGTVYVIQGNEEKSGIQMIKQKQFNSDSKIVLSMVLFKFWHVENDEQNFQTTLNNISF